jgi:hypothetical protein
MQYLWHILRPINIFVVVIVLAGCSYWTAVQRLPPEERNAFRAYSKIMTAAQARTYLAQETPAARTAYLHDIGVAQRFQALDSVDQDAVLAGYVRKGMHADALRFLWGYPYYTRGYTGHYEYWHYLGSSFDLVEYGNSYTRASTLVTVYLVDDQVDWWIETVPSHPDDGDAGDRRRN